MKVLLITNALYAENYSELYLGLHKTIGSMDVRRLGDEQNDLKDYFSQHIDLRKYDRIIIHLDFVHLKSQWRFLKKLEHVVFFDSMANFGCCSNQGGINSHLEFYQKIAWARIVVCNYQTANFFKKNELDVYFLPEGFNSNKYNNQDLEREIDMVFLKNTEGRPSNKLQKFIKIFREHFPEAVTENSVIRTEQSLLPRTKIAVCADIDRGEYSRKVFQSMACGCLVFSYSQGSEETTALSLKDMHNIVLFNNWESFYEKLIQLQASPELMEEIATKGQQLAIENHQDFDLGAKFASYVEKTMRKRKNYTVGFSLFNW